MSALYDIATVLGVNAAAIILMVAYDNTFARESLVKREKEFEQLVGVKPRRQWPYTNSFMLGLFPEKAEEQENRLIDIINSSKKKELKKR